MFLGEAVSTWWLPSRCHGRAEGERVVSGLGWAAPPTAPPPQWRVPGKDDLISACQFPTKSLKRAQTIFLRSRAAMTLTEDPRPGDSGLHGGWSVLK